MATLVDIIALVATIALFGGIIYGVILVASSIQDSMQSTKERLKERGLDISNKGVSVKTSKRMNREDYVDATQRGFLKAVEASSFKRGGANATESTPVTSHLSAPVPPLAHRSNSSSSINSFNSEEKKKRGFFSRKKTN